MRLDGDTLVLTYFDKFPHWLKKGEEFQVTKVDERAALTLTLYRKGPCLPEKDAANLELPNAKATLDRSREIADLLRGKNPGLAYWFAELYVYITDDEIKASGTFEHPGFLLHFIPIFYDMYAQNAEAFAAGDKGGISSNWRLHFTDSSVPVDRAGPPMEFPNAATASLVSGVQAHIQGDMGAALEEAYESYKRKYCKVPGFDSFKPDFFVNNRPIFEKVKLDFLHEFVDLGILGGTGPVSLPPATVARAGDVMGKGMNVDEIYSWREDSWQTARAAIAKSQADSPDGKDP
jgi:hypothetical protein